MLATGSGSPSTSPANAEARSRYITALSAASILKSYMPSLFRHPELVSGSISPLTRASRQWMLKQVQHDGLKVRPFAAPALDRPALHFLLDSFRPGSLARPGDPALRLDGMSVGDNTRHPLARVRAVGVLRTVATSGDQQPAARGHLATGNPPQPLVHFGAQPKLEDIQSQLDRGRDLVDVLA